MKHPRKMTKKLWEVILEGELLGKEDFENLWSGDCSIEECQKVGFKMRDNFFKDDKGYLSPFFICKYHYKMLPQVKTNWEEK